MNKRLKATVCAAVATCSFLAVQGIANVSPVGVDVVSAATTGTPSAPAATPSKNTSTGSTTYYRSTNSSVLLKMGSTGDAVKSLQTSLNNYGYKLDVDGFFGTLTLNAVEDFQKQHGLTVDGIVGPNTYAELNPTTPTAILGIGNSGSDVRYLQENLNKAGYNLSVDGIFGPLTLNAVKDFQKTSGLAVDGLVGPKTFAALNAKVTAVVTPPTPSQPATQPPVDVVSAASIVDTADAFQKAIAPKSKGGKWIIAITKDVTTDKELKLDGQFVNTKTPPVIARKIALYSQDDKRNITARFTLTAPKLTILSPNASIQHGTFKGDLYVSASNFQLVDAKVDGNIYFTNKSAQDTFNLDDKSSYTGIKELKLNSEVDVTTSASIVNNEDAFEKAITTEDKGGTWIIATLNNLTYTKNLVLDGTLYNKKTPPALQRKIALYAHTSDAAKATTDRFILTAPKLTVNSPSASIQHGVFKGDVYVSAPNFQLVDAIVDGNIYFTSSEYKSTFKMDADSAITGQQWLTTK